MFRIGTSAPDSGITRHDIRFGVGAAAGGTLREDVFLSDGGCDCPRTHADPTAFPDSKWIRVSIETDYTIVNARFDGVQVATQPFGGFVPTGDITVGFGIDGYENSDAEHLLDDVACTVTP
jgi:hypothetical protein